MRMSLARGRNIIIVATMFIITSCEKAKDWLNVADSSGILTSDQVFNDDNAATSAVLGMYSVMMETQGAFSNSGVTVYTGMCGDELKNVAFNIFYQQLVTNNILPNIHDTINNSTWGAAYNLIYHANSCIEHLIASRTLTPSIKTRLLGESYFNRAFFYFHLVNLFGDVPLCLTTDPNVNAKLGRSPTAWVYNQIINDLIKAKENLLENYDTSIVVTEGVIRPTKWAAMAMLAKVYLYNNQWSKAENLSDSLINYSPYYLCTDLNDVFRANSTEAIWQLLPVVPGRATWEGNFLLPIPNILPSIVLTDNLVQSFEPDDQRKEKWIIKMPWSGTPYYYAAKYKQRLQSSPPEYYMVLRLAEQYLIRAEAKAHLNKLSEAIEDVNYIRDRAGLPGYSQGTLQETLQYIEKERRSELFCEWGNRWYDLKRTGRATPVLNAIKPTWRSTAQLWPIPEREIRANSYLTQNPGY